MIQVLIPTLGAPPAFTKTTADSDYWQARFCYEESLLKYNANVAGYAITQIQQTDIESAEALMDSLSGELQTWLTSSVTAMEAGEPIPALDESYIPELIQFVVLAITGQWGLIFVLFVKVGLKFLIEWIRKKLAAGDVSEVARTMEEIILDKSDPENVINRLDYLTGAMPNNLHITVNAGDRTEDSWFSVDDQE